MPFIIIYITHENEEEAKKIVGYLLERKLIACANIFPIKSMYWWNGKIEDASEIVSIVKTRKENWTKIKKEVLNIHPYNTPCIMKIEVEANKSYESWINKSVIS
ncbi:MAG: divalent-cation tolerance protein CutA [Candidatus Micrarchaeota archaeon]|nr:divalent-cation tolerance protein CutA [Candidatus Micrarchaeota archaeon]